VIVLVREIMRSPAVTITPGTTLQDAYRLMQERSIRHLPVVEGERLVGIITDRDLRLATSALAFTPFPPGGRVLEVMHRDPLTADPCDPVEDAARVMRDRKVGCLPVLEDGKLVGIITNIDLLDGLIRLTGVDKPSGRLELRLPDRAGELVRLTTIVSSRGLNIHSVLTYPEGSGVVRTVLRVGSMDTRQVARELREGGYEVLWPPGKPCPR
jgi:acetoin utilization protein AcuB